MRARSLAISGGLVCALLVVLVLIPVPLRTRAEGVVWIPEEAFVRAGSTGFITRVVAEPGSRVDPRDLLLEIHDPVIETDVAANAARVRRGTGISTITTSSAQTRPPLMARARPRTRRSVGEENRCLTMR